MIALERFGQWEDAMASMHVSVPDTLRDWVQRRVDSGEYASESEYVHELIRRDQEAVGSQLSVEEIRQSIENGRVHGRTVPAEDVFDRLEARLKGATS